MTLLDEKTEITPEQSRAMWSALRRTVNDIAAEQGEWGGAPIPVDHVKLVMEPRYPFPKCNGLRVGDDGHVVSDQPAPRDDSYTLLNEWFCYRWQRYVYVCREANGKSRVYFMPEGAGRRLGYWMNTLGVAAGHVWDVKTEDRAMEKLASLVTEHAMNCYRLAGGFLETSQLSGVTYLFRKLRPTLALRPGRDGMMHVIAVLCLHPLGYYADSWAGVMCPTDDVVAHLMLMRGNEHGFWKKANHHEMSMASAGI